MKPIRNVLVVMTGQLRYDLLSCFGCERLKTTSALYAHDESFAIALRY